LANHTQLEANIREQQIDAAKSALSVNNGNDIHVIEYLDTIPSTQRRDE
jgi:hypothetical protein